MGFLDTVKKGLNEGAKFTKIKSEIFKHQGEIKNKKTLIGNLFVENNEVTEEMISLREEILKLNEKIKKLKEELNEEKK